MEGDPPRPQDWIASKLVSTRKVVSAETKEARV